MALKRALIYVVDVAHQYLGSLATNTSGQLDILGHDGDTLGVDGTQVGVFEQTNGVCLTSLLKSHDSRGLESKISLKVLGNLSHKTLEGKLADQELCGFLVSPNFTESNSSGPVPVGLLYSSCGWSTLPRSLGGQLLAGSFSPCRFTCSLLCTRHFEVSNVCQAISGLVIFILCEKFASR